METGSEMKALHIIVNAGHTDEIMEIIRQAGAAINSPCASGGTIIHARGEGSRHRSFLGITLDHEQEVIISIVDKNLADQIMTDIKEKAGWKTEVRGLCYSMPVDKVIGINQVE